MIRNVFRTTAIALAMLCLTITIALGATQLMEGGMAPEWQDVTSQPEALVSAEPILAVEEPDVLLTEALGPVTITLLDSCYDDQYMYQTIHVSMNDGGRAVLMPAGNQVKDPIRIMNGINLWNVEEDSSFLHTAKHENVPLYCVTMMTTAGVSVRRFDSPKTGIWTNDGGMTMTSNIYIGSSADIADPLLYVRVTLVDPVTGKMDTSKEWRLMAPIPVVRAVPLGSFNYAPKQPVVLHTSCGEVTLRGVHLELLSSRAYLYAVYECGPEHVNLAPLSYTASYTTLQGKEWHSGEAEAYNYASFDGLFITRQTIYATDAPEGLVMFDAGGLLNSDPIVLRMVDEELAEKYNND